MAEQVTVNATLIEGDQFVNASAVAMETHKNPVLSQVLQYTQHGRPDKSEPVFQPYFTKTLDLTHEDGVIFWNSPVIIPGPLQSLLLADLHTEHLGVVKMK